VYGHVHDNAGVYRATGSRGEAFWSVKASICGPIGKHSYDVWNEPIVLDVEW